MRSAVVAVTGLGMLTTAGNSAEATWDVLCQGRGLARRDPGLTGLPVDISCRVTGFDADAELGRLRARRLDPFAQLAIAAGRRAVQDAGLEPNGWPSARVGVILGVASNSLYTYVQEFIRLGRDRPDLVSPRALPRSTPSMAAAELAIDVGAHGPSFTVASACASGTTAIAVARDLLLAGSCDIVLAGGAESGCSRMAVTCFTQMGLLARGTGDPAGACRPFDREREGIVLSEGAAVLVLERLDHARVRRAPVRALLRGAGASCDAHDPVAPHPEGAGAQAAVRAALADAGCSPGDIGHVNAHGNATRSGDSAEALALLRVFGGSPPAATASKGVLGHSLGASGAVEAAVTVLTLGHQRVPPTANLRHQDAGREIDLVTGTPRPVVLDAAVTLSCGFGGQNAALVFTTV
ncbi:beta-ketoacyl-[acyl-carrier-protein] synthase family protein [Streptomyces sp. NPDC051567]|uniref:beta-ketoacyl-[acyl-carrier-protein] synthase family protein n=1 Tax=Streptomyces sp. NPDC051567 TaxID=3365660 RepID=UPI00378CE8D1